MDDPADEILLNININITKIYYVNYGHALSAGKYPVGIYLMKDNNKYTKLVSVNVALVSLLLTLNRHLSTRLLQASK